MILLREKESSFKKSKFTDAHVAFILQQANEDTSVAEICRKVRIAKTTFYNWRSICRNYHRVTCCAFYLYAILRSAPETWHPPAGLSLDTYWMTECANIYRPDCATAL